MVAAPNETSVESAGVGPPKDRRPVGNPQARQFGYQPVKEPIQTAVAGRMHPNLENVGVVLVLIARSESYQSENYRY